MNRNPEFPPEEASEEALEKEHGATFVRHSVAGYKSYNELAKSENPTAPFDHEEQVVPDLFDKGVELAKTEAEKFFGQFNPEKDLLFFASSNEARALETANIYRREAHKLGFEVVKPENTRGKLASEIGQGEIRTVRALSIDSKNVVIDSLFNHPSRRPEINWDKIDPEFKARFDEASKIIEADDRGGFGANLLAHSKKLKELIPEIETAEELYKSHFRNLVRLFKFGMKKADEANLNKSLKILAFGHENYFMHVLKEVFEEEGIKNCESFHFNLDEEDGVRGSFRGKDRELN